MEIVRQLTAPCDPSTLFGYVDDLDRYPPWMDLVHAVERIGDEALWDVELQATIGPFARSKRLRMRRTEHVVDELVVFERDESDGRHHSAWTLRADLVPLDVPERFVTELTMRLSYEGSLWSGAVLQRVLDDKVAAGSRALLDLVTAAGRTR